MLLLPKKGDLWKTGNWRPISLLNSDFKVMSKLIASRLNSTLPALLAMDQRGFVSGRDIAEDVVELQTVLHHVHQMSSNHCLINLDFKKAFDSVDWDFMFSVLEAYGFPEYTIKLIKALHSGASSRVVHRDELSEPFDISKGVLQGAPSSPPLFILMVELLFKKIHKDPAIKGVKIGDIEEKKSFRFADDATLALLHEKETLDKVQYWINRFRDASGLELNPDKTEFVPLGSVREDPEAKLGSFKTVWGQFKSLGIVHDHTGLPPHDENIQSRIERMTNMVANLKDRYFSFLGKNLLAKSLLLAQWIYQLRMIPSPPIPVLKEVQ